MYENTRVVVVVGNQVEGRRVSWNWRKKQSFSRRKGGWSRSSKWWTWTRRWVRLRVNLIKYSWRRGYSRMRRRVILPFEFLSCCVSPFCPSHSNLSMISRQKEGRRRRRFHAAAYTKIITTLAVIIDPLVTPSPSLLEERHEFCRTYVPTFYINLYPWIPNVRPYVPTNRPES